MTNVRSRKKIKRKSPGSRTVTHIRKKKPSHTKCGKCGAKMVRKRLRAVQIRKIPKNQRRPDRPLPHLCSKCMREELKNRARLKWENE